MSYTPIALLGSQVVAGTNYAVLCKISTVTATTNSALAIVYIHVDLQGNASIMNVSGINL